MYGSSKTKNLKFLVSVVSVLFNSVIGPEGTLSLIKIPLFSTLLLHVLAVDPIYMYHCLLLTTVWVQ